MKELYKRVSSLKYLASVSMITAFAVISLCGYTKPVFGASEITEYEVSLHETEPTAPSRTTPVFTTAVLPKATVNSYAELSTSTQTPTYGNSFRDGTYYGQGTGFNGELTVRVVIKNGKIFSVEIVNTNDTEEFIDRAKTLTDIIVSRQSTDVDAVSGATYSSNGIISAVRDALCKAAISKATTEAPLCARYEE